MSRTPVSPCPALPQPAGSPEVPGRRGLSGRSQRYLATLLMVVSMSACSSSFHPKPDTVVSVPMAAFESCERTIDTPGGSYKVTVSKGRGKPLLLLHELNGQTPGCLSLAKELADAGYKVYVPRFFGECGKEVSPAEVIGVTFSRRWRLLSYEGGTITRDIHAIAASISAKHRGQPLTVIGNCMSGGQALGLLAEPYVGTAVVCQPATPMSLLGFVGIGSFDSACRSRMMGIPTTDRDAAIAALKVHKDKRLISFNYRDDTVAFLPKTRDLARRVADAGAANRHLIYIGIPAGSPADTEATHDLVSLPGWRPLMIQDTEKHHSTVTGAQCKDLEIYRNALFSALGLPPRTGGRLAE